MVTQRLGMLVVTIVVVLLVVPHWSLVGRLLMGLLKRWPDLRPAREIPRPSDRKI